jgi:hypothetical protein
MPTEKNCSATPTVDAPPISGKIATVIGVDSFTCYGIIRHSLHSETIIKPNYQDTQQNTYYRNRSCFLRVKLSCSDDANMLATLSFFTLIKRVLSINCIVCLAFLDYRIWNKSPPLDQKCLEMGKPKSKSLITLSIHHPLNA